MEPPSIAPVLHPPANAAIHPPGPPPVPAPKRAAEAVPVAAPSAKRLETAKPANLTFRGALLKKNLENAMNMAYGHEEESRDRVLANAAGEDEQPLSLTAVLCGHRINAVPALEQLEEQASHVVIKEKVKGIRTKGM